MSKIKKSKNPNYYKEVAKSLGVKHLFGRWGLNLYWQAPDGPKHLSIKLIPLDGWITDPKEVYKVMKKRDFEL